MLPDIGCVARGAFRDFKCTVKTYRDAGTVTFLSQVAFSTALLMLRPLPKPAGTWAAVSRLMQINACLAVGTGALRFSDVRWNLVP
jgi:hypothetical protein